MTTLNTWLTYGWNLLESTGGHRGVETFAGLLGVFVIIAFVSTCRDWLKGL